MGVDGRGGVHTAAGIPEEAWEEGLNVLLVRREEAEEAVVRDRSLWERLSSSVLVKENGRSLSLVLASSEA